MKKPVQILMVSAAGIYILFLSACNQGKSQQNKLPKKDTLHSSIDTIPKTDKPDTFDIMLGQTDTSTLEGKRQWIKLSLLKELDPIDINYDTLIDLNFDRHPDYMIACYYQSGTGIKNGMAVYLYQPGNNTYVHNEMLSGIRNPSLFLKEKKITGFYLANGAGGGEMYRFIKGQWTITKEFYVDNNGDSSVWEIFYPQTNKMIKIVRPYAMVPPEDILQTDYPEW